MAQSTKMTSLQIRRMTYAALFLAVAMVLAMERAGLSLNGMET